MDAVYLLEQTEFGSGDFVVLRVGRKVNGTIIRNFDCVDLLSFGVCRSVFASNGMLFGRMGLILGLLFFLDPLPAETLLQSQ